MAAIRITAMETLEVKMIVRMTMSIMMKVMVDPLYSDDDDTI
jgi:hypothetical protein